METKEKLVEKLKEDWNKIMDAWRLLLSVCDGAELRDKKGYDRFDAFTMRLFLYKDLFGREEITPQEVEFIRRKLLRYREQLKKLGYQHFNVLEKPFDEVSFFAIGENWDGKIRRVSPISIQDHLPIILELIRVFSKSGIEDGLRLYIKFKRGTSPVKRIFARLNDLDVNGKPTMDWEGWWDDTR